MSVQSIYSSLGVLGFHEGFVDLLAIVRNEPSEPLYAIDIATDVIPRTILAVNSFKLTIDQNPKVSDKSAGESVDPGNFMIPPATLTASLSMPLQMPLQGWIDPAFADLYHLTRMAYAGTPTVALARNKQSASSSDTQLLIDNAADFARITVPFVVSITDAGITSSATVSAVNKRVGILTLSAVLGRTLTTAAQIYAPLRAASDIYHERAFSLVALREGVLTGCLVQNLELVFRPGQAVQVNSDIQACRLDRYHQLAIRAATDDIVAAYAALPPARFVGDTAVNVESLTSPSWSFGMSGAIDDPFFRGFQGIDLLPTSIEEFTVKVENSIVPVHSLHAVGPEPARTGYDNQASASRLNAFPFALAVEKRIMSGTLTYKAPIEPWALAERLSAHGGVGQNGLRVSADTFRLDMPNVTWAPASSEGTSDTPQNHTIQWTMVSDSYETLPELQYITS